MKQLPLLNDIQADQENFNLKEYLEKYRQFYNKLVIEYQSKTDLYDNCIFSILSVHTSFNISKRWFVDYRKGNLNWQGLGLYKMRVLNLGKLDSIRHSITSDNLEAIAFLGRAKRYFGYAFIDPNYFCLDVHMLRHYNASPKCSIIEYREIENKLRQEAKKAGFYPFSYQWAVWEYRQKKGHIDHSFLFKQTTKGV